MQNQRFLGISRCGKCESDESGPVVFYSKLKQKVFAKNLYSCLAGDMRSATIG